MSEVSDVKYVIEHGWSHLLFFEIFDSFSNQVNFTIKIGQSIVETGKNISSKSYRTCTIINRGLYFFNSLFQRIFV